METDAGDDVAAARRRDHRVPLGAVRRRGAARSRTRTRATCCARAQEMLVDASARQLTDGIDAASSRRQRGARRRRAIVVYAHARARARARARGVSAPARARSSLDADARRSSSAAFRDALVDAAIVDVGGAQEETWRAAALAREFPSVPFFGLTPLRAAEGAGARAVRGATSSPTCSSTASTTARARDLVLRHALLDALRARARTIRPRALGARRRRCSRRRGGASSRTPGARCARSRSPTRSA